MTLVLSSTGEPNAVWDHFERTPPMSTFTLGVVIAELQQLSKPVHYKDEHGNDLGELNSNLYFTLVSSNLTFGNLGVCYHFSKHLLLQPYNIVESFVITISFTYISFKNFDAGSMSQKQKSK
jgi:hypothetical protein